MHAIAEEIAPKCRAKLERAPALPREDIYGAVHKGLRWLLSDVMVTMGRTSFGHEPSARRVVAQVREVLDVCQAHLEHENTHIHTALDRRRHGASARLGGDHVHHEHSIAVLRELATQVEMASDEARPAYGRRLYLRYSAFVGENLVHMVEEEELAQAVLEEIYSTEELQDLHRTLVTSIAPEKAFPVVRLMLCGVNTEEQSVIVAGARRTFSVDQMATLVGALRSALDTDQWQALATAFLRSA
ncbi:MAG: hypothetical protein ABW133_18795 [Polyangiaceae bacterium]